MKTTNYYFLVASLPHMPRSFEVDNVPISRIQLQQRLAALDDEDRSIVDQMQNFLLWDRQSSERTDADIQLEYERLMNEVTNNLVLEIVCHRLDIRTITSALRRRRLGVQPPTGVGKYVKHIQENWEHPDLRLAHEHPWIPVFRQYFEANEPLLAERQLMLTTWKRWIALADNYYFCFESILLFLARWEIVDRWTRLNKSVGRKRFDLLLTGTLGDHVCTNP